MGPYDPSNAAGPMGWDERPDVVQSFLATLNRPTFAQAAPHLSGKGADKTVLLYKAWKDRRVLDGRYPHCIPQVRGVCVGRGNAHAQNLRQAVRIATAKDGRSRKYKEISHEFIYGASRVLIGGQRGMSDGSVGAWAAQALFRYGTLPREATGAYSDDLAVRWGDKGPPADMIAKAASQKVDHEPAMLTTVEEAADWLANGGAFPVCSNQGFTMTRDGNGFCQPRGSWPHCMMVCGVRADATPGFCIYQSWGDDNPSGPLSLDQPPNTFWIEPRVMGSMLRAQDSWAIPDIDGWFDAGDLNLDLYPTGRMYG